jgi:hypothetical protein
VASEPGHHRRWLRDQKLHAAVHFITTTGNVFDHRLLGPAAVGQSEERALLQRAQKSRSALYLLCEDQTVQMAESLIRDVRHFEPTTDGSREDVVISMLRELVQRLRRELGTGTGQDRPANRESTTSKLPGQGVTRPDATP